MPTGAPASDITHPDTEGLDLDWVLATLQQRRLRVYEEVPGEAPGMAPTQTPAFDLPPLPWDLDALYDAARQRATTSVDNQVVEILQAARQAARVGDPEAADIELAKLEALRATRPGPEAATA